MPERLKGPWGSKRCGRPDPYHSTGCNHDSSPIFVDHRPEKPLIGVLLLTSVTMGAELLGGWLWGSLALWADGWHMVSDVGALLLATLVYALARWNPIKTRLMNGPQRLLALGGFLSQLGLLGAAAQIFFSAFSRVVNPMPIAFFESLGVALLGLFVNVVSAFVLHGNHEHDHNLRAAYAHVCADALTSLLAILALCAAHYKGWQWADPLAALVGGAVVGQWALRQLGTTGAFLIDWKGTSQKSP